MPTSEIEFWREYRRRFGFPEDRIEWAVAISGAAINRAWGSTRKPSDNIPVFWRPKGLSNKDLIARLSSIPGAKVEKISKEEMDGIRRRHSIG